MCKPFFTCLVLYIFYVATYYHSVDFYFEESGVFLVCCTVIWLGKIKRMVGFKTYSECLVQILLAWLCSQRHTMSCSVVAGWLQPAQPNNHIIFLVNLFQLVAIFEERGNILCCLDGTVETLSLYSHRDKNMAYFQFKSFCLCWLL